MGKKTKVDVINETSQSPNKTDKNHICPECGHAFNRPYRLKQHELIHKNIKPFVCGQPNCNKSYSNKSHLDRHIYNVHIDPPVNVIYRCPVCMKVYANRQNLKRHIKISHIKNTGFTCDVCSMYFKKKHQLSSHMYQHTFIKPFSCSLCSTEFTTLLQKKKHMKLHKTYSCDQCDMTFLRWSLYLKHKKIAHNVAEYICDDCGRKFNKRVHMVHHSKVHIVGHMPAFYACSFENCNRTYARNSGLKQHIMLKHLDIRHECIICHAKLSTKAKLLSHLKRHDIPKGTLNQPTKEEGRKERYDIGAARTSTALRIAGLLRDPDNENIRGTMKNSKRELEFREMPLEVEINEMPYYKGEPKSPEMKLVTDNPALEREKEDSQEPIDLSTETQDRTSGITDL